MNPNKIRILFVDDEPHVLEGLARMLRPMRDEWQMTFAGSGEAALEVLSHENHEVVVCDVRMPGMDGVELLKRIAQQYPHIIRIILSGQAEEEAILKSIGCSHQYLAKPCDAESLKAVLSRAMELHRLLSDDQLRELTTRVETLPSLPDLYMELVSALRQPEVNIRTLGEIISRDVGMTAKILQLVNSAYFGISRKISSPAEAVNYLGINTVKSIVLSLHVFSQFDESKLQALSLDNLFSHSLQTSTYAQIISRSMGCSKEFAGEALMAGMLHDAGKLILAQELPGKYLQARQLSEQERLPAWQAEQKIIGADHGQLGAYLLGLWGFSEAIVEALAFHHQPGRSAYREFSVLTAVHVANAFAHRLSLSQNTILEGIDQEYLERIQVADRLEEWQRECVSVN